MQTRARLRVTSRRRRRVSGAHPNPRTLFDARHGRRVPERFERHDARATQAVDLRVRDARNEHEVVVAHPLPLA
jgi:hypothetical protein